MKLSRGCRTRWCKKSVLSVEADVEAAEIVVVEVGEEVVGEGVVAVSRNSSRVQAPLQTATGVPFTPICQPEMLINFAPCM